MEKHQNKYDTLSFFSPLFDSQVCAFTLSKQATFIHVNTFMSELLGYAADEILGKSCFELIHPDLCEEFSDMLEEILTGGSMTSEIEYIHKNGQMVDTQVVLFPVVIDEEIVEVIGIAHDITRVKLMEADLNHREYRIMKQNAALMELSLFVSLHEDRFDDILEAILRVAAHTLDLEIAVLWMYNENDSEWVAKKMLQKSTDQVTSGLRIPGPLREHFYLGKRSFFASEARKSGRYRHGLPLMLEYGIHSILSASVFFQGKLVGSYSFCQTKTSRVFTDDEQQFAASLSDLLTTVLEKNERIKLERQLDRMTHFSKFLTEHVDESLILLDDMGRVKYANHAVIKLLEFNSDELMGKPWQTLFPYAEERNVIRADFLDPKKAGTASSDLVHMFKKDGSLIRVKLERTATLEQGRFYCATFVFTKTKHAVLMPPETSVNTAQPVRDLFADYLEEAFHNRLEKQRVGVMLVELDQLSVINEAMGRVFGDQVVQKVKEALLSSGDTAVAQVDGDRFAVIMQGVSQEETAVHDVSEILNNMNHAYVVDGYEIFISMSAGLVLCDRSQSASDILQAAYSALLRSKKEHSGLTLYREGLNREASRRLLIENGLRRALERNEFILKYQPMLDAKTHKMAGVEVLLRWKSEELGIIHPEEFVPIAEESGLMVKIDNWVIENACGNLQKWRNAGHDNFIISINMSSAQLFNPCFPQQVQEILQKNGLQPDCLVLEFNEPHLLANKQPASVIFRQLRQIGVNVAIDNFGLGYNSVGNLRELSINKIKLNRSFITHLEQDSRYAELFLAILPIARETNISVAVFGVETEQQAEILQKVSYDGVQGNYYSAPLMEEELLQYNNRMKMSAVK